MLRTRSVEVKVAAQPRSQVKGSTDTPARDSGSSTLDTRKYRPTGRPNAGQRLGSAEERARARESRQGTELRRQARDRLIGLALVDGNRARAERIAACGDHATSKSEAGAICVDGIGRPVTSRCSCNEHLCEGCQRNRSLRVADDLLPVVEAALSNPAISDTLLRMVTLSRRALPHNDPRETQQNLLAAWHLFRTDSLMSEDFKHCFATVEAEYNEDGDWFHFHLHIIVVSGGRIPPKELTSEWRRCVQETTTSEERTRLARMADDKRPDMGGVTDVRVMTSHKEAIKYPLKGMTHAVLNMPLKRLSQLNKSLRRVRLLRRYGALLGYQDTETVDWHYDDEVIYCSLTGQVLFRDLCSAARAVKQALALAASWGLTRHDVAEPERYLCGWTTSPEAWDRAREMRYQAIGAELPPEALESMERRRLRARARRQAVRLAARLYRMERRFIGPKEPKHVEALREAAARREAQERTEPRTPLAVGDRGALHLALYRRPLPRLTVDTAWEC